jgi:hypothetical protein
MEYGPSLNHAIKTDKPTRDKASTHDPVAMEVSSMTFMSGDCDANGMVHK